MGEKIIKLLYKRLIIILIKNILIRYIFSKFFQIDPNDHEGLKITSFKYIRKYIFSSIKGLTCKTCASIFVGYPPRSYGDDTARACRAD